MLLVLLEDFPKINPTWVCMGADKVGIRLVKSQLAQTFILYTNELAP